MAIFSILLIFIISYLSVVAMAFSSGSFLGLMFAVLGIPALVFVGMIFDV